MLKIKLTSLALLATTGLLFVSATTLQADETDDRIESAAKKSHVFKTYLKDDSVKAKSKAGVVTLSGMVSSASNRSLAEDTVENLPGVKNVKNELTVKVVDVEQSDAWLITKVKSALLFHRHVRAGKTEVNVKDGIVTLTGEASSQAQKDLTTEYAMDVEGVKKVENKMVVAKIPATRDETVGDKIDDASITAQVKATLMSRRSTSALKTKVTTNDGVVTLTGIAKNAAEKTLVTKLVGDIEGVTSVINNMTIAVPVAAK